MYFCYSSEFYYSYAIADTNNITFFPLLTYYNLLCPLHVSLVRKMKGYV